jgi:hypothetical protein
MISNVCDVYFHHRYWAWLGYVGSKLFYDGLEMSQIASICDDFVKHSRRLNYDAQYMILSKMIIDIFMTFFR